MRCLADEEEEEGEVADITGDSTYVAAQVAEEQRLLTTAEVAVVDPMVVVAAMVVAAGVEVEVT